MSSSRQNQPSDQDAGRRLAEALAEVQQDIAQSQRLLDQTQQALAELAAQGQEQSAEYQQILAASRSLARLVAEARAELRIKEAQQAQVALAKQVQAGGGDLSGLVPLKGTMGLSDRPGVIASGPEVANLQRFLSAAGFPAPVTGEFDVKTKQALQQFQRQYGLPADGAVGASTRKVINQMLGKR